MRKVFRWIAVGFGGLVGVLAVAVVALLLVGRSRANRTYDAPRAFAASVPADPATVERGRHVMRTHGCQECHGEQLQGTVFLDIPPGRIVASNLTRGRGGVGASYTDADWDRAVRYGVRPSGKMILPFMPYEMYNRLSDDDVAALVAYLKSLPPVDNELPPSEVRVPGYLMLAMSSSDQLPGGLAGPVRPGVPPGPTAEYGEYLASTVCVACHGSDLRGGKHPAPDAPPGPGLQAAGTWAYEDFARAVRTGQAPTRALSEWMPSKFFSEMTDVELQAIHAHLKTLAPAAPAGEKTASR